MGGLTSGTMTVLAVLAIIILVLWVLLPFAVFGIKDLLQKVLIEQRQTNALLRDPDARHPPKK